MKTVCVVDLDETLGHFKLNNQFIVRPYAHLFLDFLAVLNVDIILWSYGSDTYVEHIINKHFEIFLNSRIKSCIYGRTVCEISKRKYGSIKHSQLIRKLYLDNINLIALDDNINFNMDLGYDFRIKIEPYNEKNSKDDELFIVMSKIIQYLKEQL